MEYRIVTQIMGMGKAREKEKQALQPHQSRTEPYIDTSPGPKSIILAYVIAEVAFYVLIGTLAATLSWTSNASIGWHPGFCFIFALVSFFFAGMYLISHFLFKQDLLSALRRVIRMLPPPAMLAQVSPV